MSTAAMPATAPLAPVTDFAPLAGVRILDFSHVIAGPFATFLLARLGAQVTKVESLDGDVMRRAGQGGDKFLALNAGKQHIRLDLRSEDGRRQAEALALASDVVVDNLRPGVLEGFGLGYAALQAQHPGLLYCTISGYGRGAEEWRNRPAYDHVIQAASGMAWMAGAEGDPPVKTGFPVVDSATGLLAALAILSALRERERSGRGALVDVSMAGAALQLMYPLACDALTTGSVPPRVGNQGYSGSPAANFFQAEDGWLAIGANTPRQLLAVLRVLGLGHLASDPAVFAQPLDAAGPVSFVRALDPAALKTALAGVIASRGAAELEAAISAAGAPAARLRTIAEFSREAADNGCIGTVGLTEGETMVRSTGLGFQVYRPRD
ncbi:CoA transferase [Pseudacidovorax sp. RU35E]|uniref:CoA transferase n=1 Tax=Pseudacidovorax sp. RU35E TaxID=1907403 RepID=UPI001F17CC14|nr:CoA transferase [Pseudacidovorax sp. RU35E]